MKPQLATSLLTASLILLTGFAPGVGDTFTVLTTISIINGTFAAIEVPSGYTFDVEYTATSVVTG